MHQGGPNQPINREDDLDEYSRRVVAIPPINCNFFLILRTILITIALVLIITNTAYGYMLPNNNIECLIDNTFEYTSGINNFLAENKGYKNALLIISSLLIDLLLIIMFITWALWGESWRILIALTLFYGFRGFVQVCSYLIF
jgi:hypothetical protein